MRRAQAHCGAAMLGATESTYEIDEFLGWSSGCKRHGIPPACMRLPLSLFLPPFRSRFICPLCFVGGSRQRAYTSVLPSVCVVGFRSVGWKQLRGGDCGLNEAC